MGHIFRLTTFGESHGSAIGGVIDGCPSNMNILIEEIQNQLNKRKPGQSSIVTQRKELDQVEILSGIFDGKTTGAPIGFIIKNSNQKSKDYSHLGLHMLIIPIKKNIKIEITLEEEEVAPEKLQIGSLLVP